MKVLITGVSGFFGRTVSELLRQDGHSVVGGALRHVHASQMERLDITSVDSCKRFFERHSPFDAVVHCAALASSPRHVSRGQYYLVNTAGTKNVFDMSIAFGARKFVMISTVSVYGEFDLPAIVHEGTPRRPVGAYGDSKMQAENCCLECSGKIDLYILRMAAMYAKDFLVNIRRKVVPPVLGEYLRLDMDSKSERYSFCSAQNGAETVARAIRSRIPPGIYNVADDHVYSLGAVLQAIRRVEGSKPILPVPRFLPIFLMRTFINLFKKYEIGTSMKSRYWKFFENNIYSVEKLKATGFVPPPPLTSILTRRIIRQIVCKETLGARQCHGRC